MKVVWKAELFLIILLLREISLSFQIPCPNVPRKRWALKRRLRHLRRNFLFVERPSLASSGSHATASRQIPESYECPWKWDHDDDPDRIPRFMTKAVCPGCRHYCLPVHYSQKGLVHKRDVTTREEVWKWITIELPVAFIYNAYS